MGRQRWSQEDEEAEAGDFCSRGDRCAGRISETVDGQIVTTPARTYRAFCEKDERIIGNCLDSIPGVWNRLHRALGDHIVTEVLVRMPYGPSEPVSLGVDALMRLLAYTVRTWEARTRAAAGLIPPDQDADPLMLPSVRSACRTLKENITPFLALQPAWMYRTIPLRPGRHGKPAVIPEDVEEAHGDEEIIRIGVDFVTVYTDSGAATAAAAAGNEIMRLEYAGRAVLLETPARPDELLGIPCRACWPRRTLYRAAPGEHEGDPEYWSECSECGDLMTAAEFREWVKLNHAYYSDRVTPAMAAAG